MGFIDIFGIRKRIIDPLQCNFSLDLHYFREELQGWLQCLIWEAIYYVKGTYFHPEDILEKSYIIIHHLQPYLLISVVASNLQP